MVFPTGYGYIRRDELSTNQENFLSQYGYIRLSEWRLFAHNSSRVLNPTGDGTSGMSWFYIGSPPYTLDPASNGAMEKEWPARTQ